MEPRKTPIWELGLGSRAEKALRRLGVTTLEKLLKLDPAVVLELSGCGQTVYRRIVLAQERLRAQRSKGAARSRGAFRALRDGLGSWAQRCLRLLGVKDLYDLARVRFVDFIELKGFGENTWSEIDAARRQALKLTGGVVIGRTRKVLKNPSVITAKPPTEETLHAMPLFSGLDPAFFKNPRYHKAWYADWRVSELAVTVRATSLCSRHGVKTVGELLLVPGPKFLAERNSHFGTLGSVYDALETLLLGGMAKLQKSVDYSSFQKMLRTWIKLVLSETFAPITSARFATRTDRFPTYDDLSRKFNVTRARVGQIWEKGRKELSRGQNLLVLKRFWDTGRKLVGKKAVDIETLGSKLAKAFSWKKGTVPAVALSELLALSPDFAVLRGGRSVRCKG